MGGDNDDRFFYPDVPRVGTMLVISSGRAEGHQWLPAGGYCDSVERWPAVEATSGARLGSPEAFGWNPERHLTMEPWSLLSLLMFT